MESHTTTGNDTPLLIKTNTCPACRTAVALLDQSNLTYHVITDTDSGYETAVSRYGVRHVPTLILHPQGTWEALVGADAIRGYLRNL